MRLSRYAKFAWAVLVYNIGVIAWGAYVRATGSGAGCGGHWPLCNGEVIPRSPSTQTLIEYSHRLSSGLTLILSLVLVVWGFRAHPRGHAARYGAVLAVFFTVVEAMLGATLVLFGLVADNPSPARAVVMSIHLTNTLLLLASFALCAWWASGGAIPRFAGRAKLAGMGLAALAGIVVLGVSGAVTALGDTLFPSMTLDQALAQDMSPATDTLVRLRVFHPAIACVVAILVLVATRVLWLGSTSVKAKRLALATVVLFGAQLAVGTVNVLLLAPVWLQLVHLALADVVWVVMLLLVVTAMDPRVPVLGPKMAES
jgi:heme A synthase